MLKPDGRFPNDYFGYSITVSSNALLVGAPKAKWMGVDAGAAHVFEPDSLGNWVETQRLTASDGGGTQIFGWSVSPQWWGSEAGVLQQTRHSLRLRAR